MTELTFVQSDDAPPIQATLHLQEDPFTPVDLTGCTVAFQMRKGDDRRFTVNASADVTDAINGKVQYVWDTNDLNIPGDYNVQWQITFPDDRRQTTAVANTITVRRQ